MSDGASEHLSCWMLALLIAWLSKLASSTEPYDIAWCLCYGLRAALPVLDHCDAPGCPGFGAQTASVSKPRWDLRRNTNAGLGPRGGRPRVCSNRADEVSSQIGF